MRVAVLCLFVTNVLLLASFANQLKINHLVIKDLDVVAHRLDVVNQRLNMRHGMEADPDEDIPGTITPQDGHGI